METEFACLTVLENRRNTQLQEQVFEVLEFITYICGVRKQALQSKDDTVQISTDAEIAGQAGVVLQRTPSQDSVGRALLGSES